MAQIETWYEQNLNEPVKVRYIDGNVFSQDNTANVIGVRVFSDSEPVELSGSVSGSIIRSDGVTIAVNGVRSQNMASIALPESAYIVPGILSIVIKLTDGEIVTTLCAVVANVYQTATDSVVDPGYIIPSIAELINAIDEAIAGIPADYSELSNAVGNIETKYLTDDNISFLSLANDFTYLDNTNTEQENSVISVTNYIRIPADAIRVECATRTIYNGVPSYIAPLIFFYDENKNYITRNSSQSSDVASFAIPQNAAFIRVNQPSSTVSDSVLRLIRFVYGSMGYNAIVTSDDDANTIRKPGVYWFAYNNKPAHLPEEITESGRILVIKSETLDNYGAAWQLICNNDGFFYRPCLNTAGTSWGAWNRVQRMKSAMSFKKTLTSADSLREITESGMYVYETDSNPVDAPSKIGGRTMIAKGTTDSSHFLEAQWQIIDGVFYYRSTGNTGSALQPWKSLGLGSPMYQTETLPYNAVLYHQKWSDWGGTGRSRSERKVLLGYVDDDSTLPIYAYELYPNRDSYCDSSEHFVDFDFANPPYKRPKIFLLGGVHGNEKCTPMDIWTIAQALRSRDYNDIACKFDWFFVPLANPWGYSHARLDADGNILYDNTGTTAQVVECTAEINAGIRNNGHDMNINRDWSDNTYTLDGKTYGFQTPELQLIFPYILSIKPDVFFDVHQNHSDRALSTDPMCCYVRPYHAEPANDNVLRLLRRTDIANTNTDQIMWRYCKNTRTIHHTCRFAQMPAVPYYVSNYYMAGLSHSSGGIVKGNTAHPELATDYSVLTETSEICYSFNGGSDTWYNPWACTFSCTYLWQMLQQVATIF